jgi:hypothetical protein
VIVNIYNDSLLKQMLLTYSGYKQNYCKLLKVYTSNFVVYDEYGNFVNYLQLLCSKSATGNLLKFMILVIFGNRMFSCSEIRDAWSIARLDKRHR